MIFYLKVSIVLDNIKSVKLRASDLNRLCPFLAFIYTLFIAHNFKKAYRVDWKTIYFYLNQLTITKEEVFWSNDFLHRGLRLNNLKYKRCGCSVLFSAKRWSRKVSSSYSYESQDSQNTN